MTMSQLAWQHGYIRVEIKPGIHWNYRPQTILVSRARARERNDCKSCIYQDYCPEPNHQALTGSCGHYIKQ